MSDFDVAIVGGGIAGSSLAATLAEGGLEILVLERTDHFEDRVRGEWLAPWGVAEAQRLGVYEEIQSLGGHHLTRHVSYDELLPPEHAEASAIDLGAILPDVSGALAIEHVHLQDGLLALARRAGADVRRGVSAVRVHAESASAVAFTDAQAQAQVATCRLIVGADGRASGVRRQLGIPLHEDPIDHLIAGLLVEGLSKWPAMQQSIGKAGDIQYLIFPQGGGKARLYADYDASAGGRFAGESAARDFLACFKMECVPGSEEIASATPIGPCRSYPSQDAWTEWPVAHGAVLIGDAAGYNDPIIGQGLSIALRDVRLVRDVLLSGDPWDEALFRGYGEERRERLRRLRVTAQYATRLGARFDDASVAARARAMGRIAERPELFPLAAAFAGPEQVPAEVFTDAFAEALFA